jgi:DNA-3-methyladenine glycosylase
MKRLSRKFFERPTLWVAQNLLGKILVRNYRGKKIMAIITETEAYIGENDLACHASHGRTRRTEIMYGEAGHTYIYLIYGIHYMFNIVTERKDFPAAVLIRAIRINEKFKTKNEKLVDLSTEALAKVDGPGKVTKYLQIKKLLNDEDLITSRNLWLEDSGKINRTKIKKTPRIGVDYAGTWCHKPWRFISDN